MNASSIDELVETIFQQYEEYDSATLERVWQSLFKVYNQTLRKMGDNDFSVEHTGVRVPQRAAKLERVVKYDEEALRKVRDYLALSSNVGGRQLLIFFLGVPSPPPNRGRNTAIWGETVFFSPVRPHSRNGKL